VGTAHISRDSVEEVERVIREERPAIVAIELDDKRLQALTQKDQWENTPLSEVLKQGRAFQLLVQVFLSSIQRRMGEKLGVEPGSEMLAAVNTGEEVGATLTLADRDITITLRRAWHTMSIKEKLKVFWHFWVATFGLEEVEEEIDLEELMKEDVISAMIEELSSWAPSVTEILIFERDAYLAKKLDECRKKGKTVAVVGAGHVEGIKKNLEDVAATPSYAELEQVPVKRFNLWKFIGYLIPVLFAAVLLYLVWQGNWSGALNAFILWVVINGTLSGIGAALAGGHPLSIATAFAAAPITSLNPTIAAGWFAGYVEAKVRKPAVKDYRALGELKGVGDFWRNKVTKVLLVTALANLGSMIGTWVAFGYIIPLIL